MFLKEVLFRWMTVKAIIRFFIPLSNFIFVNLTITIHPTATSWLVRGNQTHICHVLEKHTLPITQPPALRLLRLRIYMVDCINVNLRIYSLVELFVRIRLFPCHISESIYIYGTIKLKI